MIWPAIFCLLFLSCSAFNPEENFNDAQGQPAQDTNDPRWDQAPVVTGTYNT